MYGTQWFQVAKMLHGRTDDQCAKRWRENLDPSISRKPWTEKDDELLMKTYENIGRRWKDLASHFEGRPPVHCRNRVQSLVRARRRAAAATRKATQARLREKPVAGEGAVTSELDYTTGVRIAIPGSCCRWLTVLRKGYVHSASRGLCIVRKVQPRSFSNSLFLCHRLAPDRSTTPMHHVCPHSSNPRNQREPLRSVRLE